MSGAAVSIKTRDTCSGLWFESLKVDGISLGAFSPNNVVFNSTTVSNGNHTISVTSQSQNPGSIVLGTATVVLNVQNNANSASQTPTATPTASGPHYSMLGPGASLPSELACAAQVDSSPTEENAPWNQDDGTGFNSNQPPSSIPSYFYQYAPGGSAMPSSDFASVDGAYAGTTDDIFRVYACKWGIEEDYIRAQALIESHWHQDCAAAHGGTGCDEGGDFNNPAGCTTGLPTTSITPNGTFCGLQGFGGTTGSNQYASWSILNSKVYYDWMTWPMLGQSTPFAVDFRFAEMRGCVNGDQYAYYHSQNATTASDYRNAVTAANNDPNGASKVAGWTNLQYLAYGCIDTHFNGMWFNGIADSYLNEFLTTLNNASWPGGNR